MIGGGSDGGGGGGEGGGGSGSDRDDEGGGGTQTPKTHSTTFTRGRAAVARAPWLLSENKGRLDRRGPTSPRGALWAAARLTINNDGIG